jgi:diacylglycerol O-acyltransferase / wax synthase
VLNQPEGTTTNAGPAERDTSAMGGFDLDVTFEARMSASDALLWRIEKDPLLRSTIVMVMVFDGQLDRTRVTERIDRVSRVVPRLRQRVLGHPMSVATPRWEIDPNFDLAYHLRFTRAMGLGTMRDLFRIAEPIAMQGFDRARPLWEFTVVEELEGGRSALIGKVHHAVTDGVGGMKLQLELLDLQPDPPPRGAMPPAPRARHLGEAQRWVDAAAWEARRSAGNARQVAGQAVSALGRAGHRAVAHRRISRPDARSGSRAAQPADAEPVAESAVRHPAA